MKYFNVNSKACKVASKKILRALRELRGKNFACGPATL